MNIDLSLLKPSTMEELYEDLSDAWLDNFDPELARQLDALREAYCGLTGEDLFKKVVEKA